MLNIDLRLLKDIEEYCKINNITDIEKEINKFLRKGFNLTKYGSSPSERINIEKGIIKEEEEVKIVQEEPKIIQTIEVTPIEEKPQEEPKKAEIKQISTPQHIIKEPKQEEEPKPKRKYTKKVRIIKNE